MTIPERLGSYEILELIGCGGMAEVYLARRGGPGGFSRRAVVKRLHPHHTSNPAFVEMFIEEAKLAADVHHRNVVQIYELCSEDDGTLFMAMEHLDGADWKAILRRSARLKEAPPVWLSVHIVSEVLEALDFAHNLVDQQGEPRHIVHCDVTPENVFVSKTGAVKLGDFGVAVDASRAREVLEGESKGKLSYMSPEQVNGQRPDRRTDVFAAGVILWESLTLRRLFRSGTVAEVSARINAGRQPPPSSINPLVTPQLDKIVARALAPNPEERWASAGAFRSALVEHLSTLKDIVDLRAVRLALATRLDTGPETGSLDLDSVGVHGAPALDVLSEEDAGDGALTPGAIKVPDPAMAMPADESKTDSSFGSADMAMSDAFEITADTAPTPSGFHLSADLILEPPVSIDLPPVAEKATDGPIDEVTALLIANYLNNDTPCSTGDLEGQKIRNARPLLRSYRHFVLHPESKAGADNESLYLSIQGEAAGPMNWSRALAHLAQMDADSLHSASLSADGKTWISLPSFAHRMNEPLIDASSKVAGCLFAGTFGAHSLTSVFGELARGRASGVLVLINDEGHRVEVHLKDGLLTEVVDNKNLLARWRALIATNAPMASAMSGVLTSGADVDMAVEEPTRQRAALARAYASRRTLIDAFSWESGRFAFDGSRRPKTYLKGQAALTLLPKLLARGLSSSRMRAALRPWEGRQISRTPAFAELVEQLNYTQRFGHLLHALRSGQSLEDVCRQENMRCASDELVLAEYLASELRMIRPSLASGRARLATSRPGRTPRSHTI